MKRIFQIICLNLIIIILISTGCNNDKGQSRKITSIKRDKLIANTREVMDGYKTFGNVYLGGTAMIASDMISF